MTPRNPVLRMVWWVWLAVPCALAAEPAEDSAKAEEKKGKDEERIVVTATRLETPYEQVGSSTTVITRADIERSQKRTVVDLLRSVPGLDVIQAGGPGGTASVFIRGAKSEHTLVLIDGIEANDPSTPGRSYDWCHLTSDNIERIEVIRGPQSTLYGSDAIGGVINIITRKGTGKPSFYFSTEAGSFRTFKETLGASGSQGPFNFAVDLSRFDTRGISSAGKRYGNHEKDGYENTSFSSHFGYKASDNLDFDVFLRCIHGEAELDNFGGPYGDDPNYTSESRQRFFRTQGRLLLLNGLWEQKFGVSCSDHHRSTRNDPDAAHPGELERSSYDGRILKLDWQHNFYLHDTNTLTLGAETEEERGKSRYHSESFWGPFDSNFDEQTARTNSFYAQDQIRLWDCFFTTVGFRRDDHSTFGGKTTYRVASSYLVKATGTRFKGSVGTGFKAPALFQLYSAYGNPALQPEESKGCDFGVEQDLFGGVLTLGATCFHNEFTNLIDYNLATWLYENVAQATSKGVELTATVRPIADLTLRASCTHTDTEDKATGRELLRRAKHRAALDASYRLFKKLNLNLGVACVGERSDMDFSTWPATRVTLGSYVLVNCGVSYDISDNFTVFGRVENLLDRRYEEVKGYGTPGVGVFAGVRARF